MFNYQNLKSAFWLNQDYSDVDILTEKVTKDPTADLIRLASYRKAISNFVNLVTGKSIPVTFTTTGDSYTDGKSVTISSNLNEKSFDSAVGLALHEGSHILLSDFKLLENLYRIVEALMDNRDKLLKSIMKKYDLDSHRAIDYIVNHVKILLNIIEDRRIDIFIYKTSPGYKGYYHELYNKYFNSRIVDKGLESTEFREENWDSYLFRLTNLINANRDLDALYGMKAIYKKLDLKNIDRLKNTSDALGLAVDIFETIEDNIPTPPKEDKSGDGEPEDSKDSSGESPQDEDKKDSSQGDSGENQDSSQGDSGGNSDIKISDHNDPGDSGLNNKSLGSFDLNDKQKKQLEKAIEAQKKFLSGAIKKKNLSKANKSKLKAFENSEADIKSTGTDIPDDSWSNRGDKGCKTLVINKFGWPLIEVGLSGLIYSKSCFNHYSIQHSKTNIKEGLILGTMLGRKLQIRNEEKDTKYNRLSTGKIDKRLISGLGYGLENVFNQTVTEKYNAANIHLSIDASGSMSGSKWDKALVTAIAIAKAASMIGNMNIQISFRSTTGHGPGSMPVILMAYDSKIDKISKIRDLFPYLHPGGLTPEGLCFEAILSKMEEKRNGLDSYFINFSDGQPYFSLQNFGYSGPRAIEHTKSQVKKMRLKGINILSYFISNSTSDYDLANFRTMYGKDASDINVKNLGQLSKSLNNMFLEK